ncbi:hypothetical protein I317_04753 [Kwoniella heveanensis CBS 569]|nr:hypothetical protein I317_04753 [Kwoniella heveanensis CBS 569]
MHHHGAPKPKPSAASFPSASPSVALPETYPFSFTFPYTYTYGNANASEIGSASYPAPDPATYSDPLVLQLAPTHSFHYIPHPHLHQPQHPVMGTSMTNVDNYADFATTTTTTSANVGPFVNAAGDERGHGNDGYYPAELPITSATTSYASIVPMQWPQRRYEYSCELLSYVMSLNYP